MRTAKVVRPRIPTISTRYFIQINMSVYMQTFLLFIICIRYAMRNRVLCHFNWKITINLMHPLLIGMCCRHANVYTLSPVCSTISDKWFSLHINPIISYHCPGSAKKLITLMGKLFIIYPLTAECDAHSLCI